MASRDLTSTYIERRNAALKRRSVGGGGGGTSTNGGGGGIGRGIGMGKKSAVSPRLTAGGLVDGDDHSLMLMEVRL
jgi:hypothetical protein